MCLQPVPKSIDVRQIGNEYCIALSDPRQVAIFVGGTCNLDPVDEQMGAESYICPLRGGVNGSEYEDKFRMSENGSEESMVLLKSGKAKFALNPVFEGNVAKTAKSRATTMMAQGKFQNQRPLKHSTLAKQPDEKHVINKNA